MADDISNLKEGEALFYTFPNTGILFSRVPKEIMDRVNKVIQKLIDTDFKNGVKANYKLTANIEKEFDLSIDLVPYMLNYITDLAMIHDQRSSPHHIREVTGVNSSPRKFKFKDIWVNFQKKGEFHPHHIHGGVYSFSMWPRVPYKIADERQVYPNSTLPVAGNFVAYYSDALGQTRSIPFPVDNEYEGIIALFPSKLGHSVNPFYTSDDYRVSVSGDLVIDTD
jgi:hypothetical protein